MTADMGGGYCPVCDRNSMVLQKVEDGAYYWKCKDCGLRMIKAGLSKSYSRALTEEQVRRLYLRQLKR